MYARSANSFLTWAHEEGLLPERLRIQLLPDPPKPLTGISDAEIRRIVLFHPRGRLQVRTWTLILLPFDAALRIDEALSLVRGSVDLHNGVIRVRGKGNRERLVPISLECRKRLFLLLKGTTVDSVFATSSGLPLNARNAYRDIKIVCAAAGVSGPHIHPHAFRHCFAVTYIRRGGDIVACRGPCVNHHDEAVSAIDGFRGDQRRASTTLTTYLREALSHAIIGPKHHGASI